MSGTALAQNSVVVRQAVSAVQSSWTVPSGVRKVRLRNVGPNTAYVACATGVTDANGFPLLVVTTAPADTEWYVAPGITLYFICAATQTADVAIMPEY